MRRSIWICALVLFSFAGRALAGPATDVVKARQAALLDLLRQSAIDDRKVTSIFDDMLDYQGITTASLGREWAARSPAEKKELTALVTQLVRGVYRRNLEKMLNDDVEYVGEEADGKLVLVKTKAASKTDAREDPIEIGIKVAQVGSRWRVEDIVVDGVSLVASYRSQFTRIIKKAGVPALIRTMKDRLAKGGG